MMMVMCGFAIGLLVRISGAAVLMFVFLLQIYIYLAYETGQIQSQSQRR